MFILISYVLPFLVTSLVTVLLIKYPVSLSIPTNRGLHNKDTASSGGIAIMAGILIMPISLPMSFIYSLILATLMGFIDDKYSLSKGIRFLGQALIAMMIVFSAPASIGPIMLLWMIFIIYFINIYNFMDGIDMIATMQGIFFLLASGLIFNNYSPIFLPLLAFLFFNLPPAKIFLGNAGSYLIGTLLSCYIYFIGYDFSLTTEIISCFILLTIFIVDSTYVLLKRFCKKFIIDKESLNISIRHVMEPHCSHNYQILAKKYSSHKKVVIILMSYNILWCLPLAYLCTNTFLSNNIVLSLLFLFLSYCPYIYYCHKNESGKE